MWGKLSTNWAIFPGTFWWIYFDTFCHVAQGGLELLIFLLLPPKWWEFQASAVLPSALPPVKGPGSLLPGPGFPHLVLTYSDLFPVGMFVMKRFCSTRIVPKAHVAKPLTFQMKTVELRAWMIAKGFWAESSVLSTAHQMPRFSEFLPLCLLVLYFIFYGN